MWNLAQSWDIVGYPFEYNLWVTCRQLVTEGPRWKRLGDTAKAALSCVAMHNLQGALSLCAHQPHSRGLFRSGLLIPTLSAPTCLPHLIR